MKLVWIAAALSCNTAMAQDGERAVVGQVKSDNFRAPFGDDVEIFNLGSQINTSGSEYNPVISPDARFMLYTTRHDSLAGEKLYDQDRMPYENIHIATESNGRYSAGALEDHPIIAFTSAVNTRKHEAPVYINQNAEQIILFKENNLWFSNLVDGAYATPIAFSKNINFKYYHRHASLTADGKTLVFTAEVLDKKLNRFHLDIFRTTQDEAGNWSKPERLPRFINSPYNEDSPEISGWQTSFLQQRPHRWNGRIRCVLCRVV